MASRPCRFDSDYWYQLCYLLGGLMGKLEQIQKEIKAKYNLNVIKDVVLSRENRSIYYIEFDTINLLFKKIYGASALDKIEKSDGLHMEDIEQHFESNNKYGEITKILNPYLKEESYIHWATDLDNNFIKNNWPNTFDFDKQIKQLTS